MKLVDYIRENTTVTDFAKQIGKSRAQVHRYILGRNLTKDVIEKIRDETKGAVSPSDFFAPTAPSDEQPAAKDAA